MAGRAHGKREAAAGESNLQRFFDRERLDAFVSLAAIPSERVMLANVIPCRLPLFRGEVDMNGTRGHPSPTSSALGTDSVAMNETASRTSGLKSLPPFSTQSTFSARIRASLKLRRWVAISSTA